MSSDTQFVIRPEEIPETGEIILRAGQVPLFLGEPGIGKSANMATLAERRMNSTTRMSGKLKVVKGEPGKGEYGLFSTVLGNYEAIDIGGLPASYADKKTGRLLQTRAMMDILPQQGPGLWVIDEAGQNPDVFRMIAQLVWDRRINGDYTVPDGVDIVLLSNRAEDRAGSSRMYTHLTNRVVQVTIEPTVEGFLRAEAGNLVEDISSTVSWFPELLRTFNPKSTDAFASPRSWMMLNSMMAQGMKVNEKTRPIVNGTIGSRAGAEFATICRMQSTLPDIDAVLLDPAAYEKEIQDIAKSTTIICALSIVLSKRVKKETDLFGPCIDLMGRLSEERAVSFVRLASITNPDVLDLPDYGAFVSSHPDMFF